MCQHYSYLAFEYFDSTVLKCHAAVLILFQTHQADPDLFFKFFYKRGSIPKVLCEMYIVWVLKNI